MGSNQLKNAFDELRVKLQKNSDNINNAIEKRDKVYWAPSASIDIEHKINTLLDGYKERAKSKLKMKLGALSRNPEQITINEDLFVKTIKFDGSNISIPDIDILVYFFRESFNPHMESLVKLLKNDNAGLPSAERNKLIKEIDHEISNLQIEKEKLYQHVKDAGLIIKEEYEIDTSFLPKQKTEQNIKLAPEYEPGLNEVRGSFDMHPNGRIKRRNNETSN